MVDVKFCGMRRPEDVRVAAALGATHVGVIFTESSRRVTAAEARRVLSPTDHTSIRRVGVFGAEPIEAIADAAREARLDVVQLVGDRPDHDHAALRAVGLETWQVVRIGPDGVTEALAAAFSRGDATLLDAWSPRGLGGTGESFDWGAVAGQIAGLRRSRRIILAGGLRPENVAAAVEALGPDLVDVSSGVEISPGVKDHDRMARFIAAAAAAHTGPG